MEQLTFEQLPNTVSQLYEKLDSIKKILQDVSHIFRGKNKTQFFKKSKNKLIFNNPFEPIDWLNIILPENRSKN